MTKSCKEMNFLTWKKTSLEDKNSAKDVKSELSPPLQNGDGKLNNVPSVKKEVNLEQKFNDDNFNEKDFEHSFHSQIVFLYFFLMVETIFKSQTEDLNNIMNQSDDYFNEEDICYYKEKFKDDEKKACRKISKSKKIRFQ